VVDLRLGKALRRLGAALTVAAVVLMVPPSAIAAKPAQLPVAATGSEAHHPMDMATCAQLIASARANAHLLSADERASLSEATPADCEWVLGDTKAVGVMPTALAHPGLYSPRGREAAQQVTLAASGCTPYDKSAYGNILGFTLMTMRLNGRVCWNGTTVWEDWKDCHFTEVLPIWWLTIRWCGVYHSGWPEAEPGMNGAVATYTAPWWTYAEPYMRLKFNAKGALMMMWYSWR